MMDSRQEFDKAYANYFRSLDRFEKKAVLDFWNICQALNDAKIAELEEKLRYVNGITELRINQEEMLNIIIKDLEAKLAECERNGENFIVKAAKDGYKITYYEPWDALTDEANEDNTWGVERTKPPFCDKDKRRYWTGRTAKDALEKAREALDKDERVNCDVDY